MISLILAMYIISEKLLFIGEDPVPRGSYCLELQILSSHVRSEDVLTMAEERWKDDPNRLEGFYTFWENRDTCLW